MARRTARTGTWQGPHISLWLGEAVRPSSRRRRRRRTSRWQTSCGARRGCHRSREAGRGAAGVAVEPVAAQALDHERRRLAQRDEALRARAARAAPPHGALLRAVRAAPRVLLPAPADDGQVRERLLDARCTAAAAGMQGMHANAQLAYILGAAARYEATGEANARCRPRAAASAASAPAARASSTRSWQRASAASGPIIGPAGDAKSCFAN